MAMSLRSDPNVIERRMERLEHRFRRAQNALAGARAVYGALREMPDARDYQLHQAWLQVQQAQAYLSDLQSAIEHVEEQQDVA
jgi:gamma-glutamyl phosphate reductase